MLRDNDRQQPAGARDGRGRARVRRVRIAPDMLVSDGLQLQRRLGKGGMGTVWVAHNSKLDTQVAIKFIERYLLQARPDARKRFEREARVAAQLSCPHVVRTQDYGALADGTPYLVMELLKGESLQQRLRGGGTLTPRQTALVVSQTALALQEAHDKGIIHRDIKPANLFLQQTRYDIFVKLLDFGIAKDTQVGLQQLTQTGSVLGSPRYMSPEQLVNDADWRADLWSLAAVAYRCLAGRAPFEGEDLIAIARNVLSSSYVPVGRYTPSLSAALDDWFAQAFNEDIAARPQSAEELASSFEEALGEHATDDSSAREIAGRSGDVSRARAALNDVRGEPASFTDNSAESNVPQSVERARLAEGDPFTDHPIELNVSRGIERARLAEGETLSDMATLLRAVPSPLARRRSAWPRWWLAFAAMVLLGGMMHRTLQSDVRPALARSAGLAEQLQPVRARGPEEGLAPLLAPRRPSLLRVASALSAQGRLSPPSLLSKRRVRRAVQAKSRPTDNRPADSRPADSRRLDTARPRGVSPSPTAAPAAPGRSSGVIDEPPGVAGRAPQGVD